MSPTLLRLHTVHGPFALPSSAAHGVTAFHEAVDDYDLGRALEAARGFMRAASLFIAERAEYGEALEKQASIAYENAALAFELAGARDEGAKALAHARVRDDANGALLDALAARLAA